MEAKYYYHGLHSKAILVARTGTDIWETPADPEASPRKELRTVGNHSLKEVWEDNLAFRIHDILKSDGVQWTSTEVARIGFAGESMAPVVIWIGVKPNSLSGKDGLAVARKCKELLTARNILDVEVEIRESVVTRYVGHQLRKHVPSNNPVAELLEPLTPTLGLAICNASTPWAEGTGGFYVTDKNSKLYLVTARHVVFKPDIKENKKYERKSICQRRVKVALFGTASFSSYVERIKTVIRDSEIKNEALERAAKNTAEGHSSSDATRRVEEAKDAVDTLKKLRDDVEKGWTAIDNRILGHVRFSPPIKTGAGVNQYTEDYALIELDRSKFCAASFTGNSIDLGTKFEEDDFAQKMFPNATNDHVFHYPANRLFRVVGLVPDEDMRKPPILDQRDTPCLVVVKRGRGTNLTIGRACDLSAYVRNYFDDQDPQTSKEWAIYTYDSLSDPFSEEGDSGSAIVDCFGRLGGLLTGGNRGHSLDSDVTYATPISFILNSLKANGYEVTVEGVGAQVS